MTGKMLDVSRTRKIFEDAGLLGAVALIDFLISEENAGRPIAKIGSAAINTTDRPTVELTLMQVLKLPSFHLGRINGKANALSDLAVFAEWGFDCFPKNALKKLDEIFAEFADPQEKNPWKRIFSLSIVRSKKGPAH